VHCGSFVGVPLFQMGLEVNLAVILKLSVDLYDFCDILYEAMDRSVPICSSLSHFCTDPDPVPLPCRLLCTTSSFIADRDHVIPAHACALGARFEGIKFSAFLFDWDADGDGDFGFVFDFDFDWDWNWDLVTDGCEASRHSLGSPNPTQSRKGTERKGKDRTGRSKRDWFLHFPYTLEN